MRKRVVIVGMGDTGLLTAVRLSRDFDVVGVSTKPCMLSGQELGLRLSQPTRWRVTSLIEFGRYRGLDGVRIIHGQAVSLDADRRELQVQTAAGSRETLSWDALLIATGVSNGFWRNGRLESREQVELDIEERSRRVVEASSLAVVGGGPSGVSVALNAALQRRSVAVHLFYSGGRPLPGYHSAVRDDVVRRLQQAGVMLHAEHRAVVPDDALGESMTTGPVCWQGHQPDFEADLVVWTIGRVRPNTDFVDPEMLDEAGFVRVDRWLQVPGCSGMFAVGDVAATDPHRSSARNQGHRVAAHNISAWLRGRPQRMRVLPPLPKHRWGSVFGLQADGLRVYFPSGVRVRFGAFVSRWLLFRFIVGGLLYRGIRGLDVRRLR